MRLIKDHSPGAYAVHVRCCGCHTLFLLADVVADLDGTPFFAYYCEECSPEVTQGKCNRDGCTRKECQE